MDTDSHDERQWWDGLFCQRVTIVITLFTISFKAVKAALMNPVKSLETD